MGKAYSQDLRLLVLRAVDSGQSKFSVHRSFGISRSTIDDWLALREQTGALCPKPRVAASRSAITDWVAFEEFATRHSGSTLRQMSVAWQQESGRALSLNTFSLALRRIGWTHKKSFLYAERDASKRAEFERQLSQIAPEDRVYRDEAGVEETLSYPWGWSLKGTRCLAEKLGHRTTRVSMAAGWCCGEVISALTFEGYCDSAWIETWFKLQFCGALRAGQTVILDNASLHRKAQLTALLEQAGCFLLFVPPDSPDLNKIEPLWNQLKLRMMLDHTEHPDCRTKVDAALL